MKHFLLTTALAGSAVALLTLSISPAQADTRYSLRVDGITCPFCVATSEKALKKISGVKSVSSNLKTGVFSVCAAPSARITASRMRSLFSSKGFTYKSMSKSGTC